MTKFGVYNRFAVRPGRRDQLVKQLLAASKLVEDAPGCELYIVNTSSDDPDVVWVTEVWESEGHHRASLAIEGVPALIQETLPLLAAPPQQIRVTPLGGKGLAR
jgi:quinol monooxygenase YgiN